MKFFAFPFSVIDCDHRVLVAHRAVWIKALKRMIFDGHRKRVLMDLIDVCLDGECHNRFAILGLPVLDLPGNISEYFFSDEWFTTSAVNLPATGNVRPGGGSMPLSIYVAQIRRAIGPLASDAKFFAGAAEISCLWDGNGSATTATLDFFHVGNT